MLPPVGSSSPSTSFAVVVLPQPDSPTTPSVLPALDRERDIVHRAHHAATAAEHASPRREMLAESRCLEHGHQAAPLCMRRALAQPAARGACRLPRLNSGGASLRQRSNAAGQRAANAQPRGKRDRSGGWPSIAVSRWRLSLMRGIEFSSASVYGCAGALKMRETGPGLHHAARIHHHELVAHLGDDAEIVGDEDQRQAMLALQVAQQAQVLRLDRQIEAGGRFVGDQQARLAGDADGADDALAHAAGHLVRDTASRASPARECAPTSAARAPAARPWRGRSPHARGSARRPDCRW